MEETTYELARERLGACGLALREMLRLYRGRYTSPEQPIGQVAGKLRNLCEAVCRVGRGARFPEIPRLQGIPGLPGRGKMRGLQERKMQALQRMQVRSCSEGKKVDFCFCVDFPCDNTGFDEHLYTRYVGINERMKEIGVEAYYEEVKNQSRY